MSLKRRVWVPGVMAVIVGAFVFRVVQLAEAGGEVNWLAELWWPSAVLSIGLVTCADLLLRPPLGKRRKKG